MATIYRFVVYMSMLVMLGSVFCSTVFGATTELRLIYVSKLPEIVKKDSVGGLAELGTLLQQTRAEKEHVMFLHGGDSLAPSFMSSFDHGSHMIDVLNSLEPDVYGVNEREFAYGEDELILRISEAAFPFVCSNLIDPLTEDNLEGVYDHVCFTYGEHKVCVLNTLDSMVISDYLPDRIVVSSGVNAIKKLTVKLREEGADAVILLTGYPLENMETLFSEYVDVILYANSEVDGIEKIGRGIYGMQGTTDGKVLVMDLLLQNHAETFEMQSSGKLMLLRNYLPAKEIEQKITYYVDRLSSIMKTRIGETLTAIDTTYNSVRTQENGFANVIADSLREYYGADVSIINGGSIRGNRIYPPGTNITRQIIQSELPFLNESRLVVITGKQLIEVLENGLSRIEEKKGRFLHLSGMNITYCPADPVGERVKKVWVNEEPLQLEKKYSLAANHYLINGGDGFTVLKEAKRLTSTKGGKLIWDIAREYIEKAGSISPAVQGRLRRECAQ